MQKYILDDKHNPVPVDDVQQWGRWYEVGDRHVGDDVIGNIRVSTVFLGLDHAFDHGPPLLFETMVFGGALDGEREQYSTWAEAEAGHAAMLTRVADADNIEGSAP